MKPPEVLSLRSLETGGTWVEQGIIGLLMGGAALIC